VSRTRGVALQREFAAYLAREGWVGAESAGSGRQGRDILGTPGVAWEVKTAGAANLRPAAWIAQAARNSGIGDYSAVAWFPPGVAMGSPGKVVAMMPLTHLVTLMKMAQVIPSSPVQVIA